MKNTEYIKSPLNYVGSKFKLLSQILPLFPKNINKFVDLFAGGCNVSINVNANKYYINDVLYPLIQMYDIFYDLSFEEINNHILERIFEFNLSKINKLEYLQLRTFYNETKNPLDLFVLICHSFNNQIRFNNKWEFNNPFGHRIYNFNMQYNLKNFLDKFSTMNIMFSNCSFLDFDFSHLGLNDFVYCDPPYLITNASYNSYWNSKEEVKLLELLDNLTSKNIKFALSNVLEYKNKSNTILIEWSKKYNIHKLDYNYGNNYNHHKRRNKEDTTIEVLITNY